MRIKLSEISNDEWTGAVTEIIKAHMRDAGVNCVELARRLRHYGFDDGNRTLSGRINRGTFSAAFMLQCLSALGVKTLDVPLGAGNGTPITKPNEPNRKFEANAASSGSGGGKQTSSN